MTLLPATAASLLIGALLLGGCAGVNGEAETPGGCLPYSRQAFLVVVELTEIGCLTQMNGRWAATARHVVEGMPMLLEAKVVKSVDYDLAFVRRDGIPAPWRQPRRGEWVTASGNKDKWGQRSLSKGTVNPTGGLCIPPDLGSFKCADGFFTSARGGPGFSGGPIIGGDGSVLGILNLATRDGSLMQGYQAIFVMQEFERLVPVGER